MSHFLYTLEFLLLSLNILDRGGKRGFLSEQRTHPLGEIAWTKASLTTSDLYFFLSENCKKFKSGLSLHKFISTFVIGSGWEEGLSV